MFKQSDLLFTYYEYSLSVVLFNIFIYVILLYSLFSLFFIFDLKYVKTLNELKYANYMGSISMFIIIGFLSLAGIPPLLGFSGKFYLFIYFFSKSNIFYLSIFVIYNFLSLFFYLQNTRFLASTNPKIYFNIKNNFIFIDSRLLPLLALLNIINILGFLISEDILAFFHSIFSYVY